MEGKGERLWVAAVTYRGDGCLMFSTAHQRFGTRGCGLWRRLTSSIFAGGEPHSGKVHGTFSGLRGAGNDHVTDDDALGLPGSDSVICDKRSGTWHLCIVEERRAICSQPRISSDAAPWRISPVHCLWNGQPKSGCPIATLWARRAGEACSLARDRARMASMWKIPPAGGADTGVLWERAAAHLPCLAECEPVKDGRIEEGSG